MRLSFLGQSNILAISPSNRNLITNLTEVQLVPFNEQVSGKPLNLGLKKISSNDPNQTDKDIYVTAPFEPPKDAFKIYVSRVLCFLQ